MYEEDTTAEELADNPKLGVEWNGVNYDLEINEDGTITFHPLDDTEGQETTLSFEEVTQNLQSEDVPFNTAR